MRCTLSLSLSLAASQRSRAVFKALPPSTPLNRARSHHPRSSFLRRSHLQFVFQLQSIFTDEMNDGAKEEDPARSCFFFTNPSRPLPAGTRGVEDEPERGRRAAPLQRKSVCGEWHPSVVESKTLSRARLWTDAFFAACLCSCSPFCVAKEKKCEATRRTLVDGR